MAAGGRTVAIYALCDPDTMEQRYIGKTVDLAERMRAHRWEAKNGKFQTHKANWLRSLGSRDPVAIVLAEVDFEEWQTAERSWIAESRRLGNRLTNFADGGQTSPVEGKGHTEESKAKMRLAAIANGAKPPSQKGRSPSAETRAKLRESAMRNGTIPPSVGGWNKGVKKPRCPSGHAYSAENTRVCFRRNRSYQVCRLCESRIMREYRNRKKGV